MIYISSLLSLSIYIPIGGRSSVSGAKSGTMEKGNSFCILFFMFGAMFNRESSDFAYASVGLCDVFMAHF